MYAGGFRKPSCVIRDASDSRTLNVFSHKSALTIFRRCYDAHRDLVLRQGMRASPATITIVEDMHEHWDTADKIDTIHANIRNEILRLEPNRLY